MTIKVPMNDLNKQYLSIKRDVDNAIAEVIANSAFIRGYAVERFEQSFSSLFGSKCCLSCGNGTDAIYIALRSLDLKPGDEVIVPANSWISTSAAVTQANGSVVFCDIDPENNNIDLTKIEHLINNKTVGIIPVHLFGQPVDMKPVCQLAKKHGLWVIEDCAQAHLASINGKSVGLFGDAGTFSMYPGKNLGAMGDAGAIITNDKNLDRKMRMFARHGGLNKGEHIIQGVNSRMDGMQAAILDVKLKHLPTWTAKRESLALNYIERLSGVKNIRLPSIEKKFRHVFHLFVIKSQQRNELRDHLKRNGVMTSINYPVSLPFLQAYSYQENKIEDFPNSYKNQNEILSIPLFPEMTHDQLQLVISAICSFAPVDRN
jgi:dTDP-4-amino-4,6-dideoxygalactose transaminase